MHWFSESRSFHVCNILKEVIEPLVYEVRKNICGGCKSKINLRTLVSQG